MKKEVILLRKAQRIMSDLMYPGYPFQLTLVIDLEDKVAWVDAKGKKQLLKDALREISPSLLYRVVGCEMMTKGSWLITQDLGSLSSILKADYDKFYVDDTLAAKFYCALMNAIYSHKKYDKGFIFACIDEDTEWVEVKVLNDLQEIEQYMKDYFTKEEEL